MNIFKSVVIQDSEINRVTREKGVYGYIIFLKNLGVPVDNYSIKEVWRMDEKGLCFYQYKVKVSWLINDNN